MDWFFVLVSLAVMLPFLILAFGQVLKRHKQAIAKQKNIMTRIGLRLNERQEKEVTEFFDRESRWFLWVIGFFKQAGFSKHEEIAKFVAIEVVLVVISVLSLLLQPDTVNGQTLFLFVLLPFMPIAYLFLKIRQRQTELRRQFPEMLDSIVRSLQAGHGIDGALSSIAKDMNGPLAEELEEVNKQLVLGISMREVLREFQVRVALPEAQYFVITLIIQRETGGQLVSILSELAKLMRRRVSFQSKLNTLTAESRFTAWFVGGSPVVYILYKYFFDKESMRFFLHDPLGGQLFVFSLVMIAIGAVVLNHMLKMRF